MPSNLRQRLDAVQKVAYYKAIGAEIGIEFLPGDTRFGRKLKVGYGHIRKTEGVDGDAVDVYLSPEFTEKAIARQSLDRFTRAFRVTQVDPDTGELDEYKFMLGFQTMPEAQAAYLSAMPRDRFGGIEPVKLSEVAVRPRQGSAAANLEATEAERNLQKIIERSLKKDGSALKPWLADAIAFFKRYDSSEAAAKAMGALYRSLPRDRLVDAIAQQMLVCHLAGMDSVEAEYQNAANQTSP